jgi:putative spermidine/putrescine transport system substrate-binding protein
VSGYSARDDAKSLAAGDPIHGEAALVGGDHEVGAEFLGPDHEGGLGEECIVGRCTRPRHRRDRGAGRARSFDKTPGAVLVSRIVGGPGSPAQPERRRPMRARPLALVLSAVLLAAMSLPARAADPLVISVWGGNWKDTVEKIVARPFTAKTGIPVEFEVGGTLDRLAKARVSKAAPLVDLTFTTTHVGRLYMSDGLFAKLDMAKIPSAKDLAKEAVRSDSHLGVWAYVYTIAYRPDQVQGVITKWADLWEPRLKGKVGMPDFDPSHIITISALLEGGDEINWQKGQERLKRIKPNIAAFFSTDARSQDLMKTGEAPVQVMLSINAFHLIDQGLNVKVITPTDKPGIVGIDTVAVMAGTKKADAAHQFIDFALSKEIQEQLVASFKAGPTNLKATVPDKLRGQPGVFTSPAEWKERGYIMNDDARAKTLAAWKEWFNASIVAK